MRVICLVLALAACSAGNGSAPPPATVPAETVEDAHPAPAADPQQLTEDMIDTAFPDGPAQLGATAYAAGDCKVARDQFIVALDAATPEQRPRVQLMIGLCSAQLRDWPDAADRFEQALAGLPTLADWLHYQAARSRYFTHEMARALAHAQAVPPESIVAMDAQLLAGDVLEARADWPAVAAAYEAYLAAHPSGIRLSEARFRLAEAREKLGQPAEALARYRAIGISDPLSSWADKAAPRMDALLASATPHERAVARTLDAAELIERGMVYYDAMRNPKSAADFEAALKAPGITAEQACVAAYHLADSWFKERDRALAGPLFDQASVKCAATTNVDLQVKSAYQAGRAYMITRAHREAADRFAKAETIAARNKHSYADDARVRQAEAWRALGGSPKRETDLLARVPELYPDGDMRGEALWRLAWAAWQAGDRAGAAKWLEKQIAAVPVEHNYWAKGQAYYWLGRARTALGDRDAGAAAWEQAVRSYPLSYYAMLALNRLREQHPDRFTALVAELRRDPPGWDAGQPAFKFSRRPLWAEPGFRRAIEYLRLGLSEPAEAELRKLGLTPPANRDEVTDPDQIEQLWAMAFLYHRARRYDTSHWVTRWHVLDYERSWPVGANRMRWQIAYPLAYRDLVDKNAAIHGYPWALQLGIMREESAFDPKRESWANAIGLTQMIFETAERFGKGTGIAITRENLQDPDKNMTIGSNFLGMLWKMFEGRAALVPPAYNAGENGLKRWLRQLWTGSVDELAEAIPGDQARNYSKRVLASYFAYSWIYDGVIPEMPNDLPPSLAPPVVAPRTPGKGADGVSAEPSPKKPPPRKGRVLKNYAN
ncbi:MAG TPA: transglycosylase SLT domain-containing protein [Kofleriaceae bacterium]|nr:transglycosylase SLT domain-containing protein [Kofleriaceae bacterium]